MKVTSEFQVEFLVSSGQCIWSGVHPFQFCFRIFQRNFPKKENNAINTVNEDKSYIIQTMYSGL